MVFVAAACAAATAVPVPLSMDGVGWTAGALGRGVADVGMLLLGP